MRYLHVSDAGGMFASQRGDLYEVAPTMQAHSFIEDRLWAARFLDASGFSSDPVLCELLIPCHVKDASLVNKTVAGKRRSLVRISNYQHGENNREAKLPSSSNCRR